jgi:hypothetical protein
LGVIVLGFLLAVWGAFLVHDLLGMAAAWTKLDEMFPAGFQSPPGLAGRCLLVVGTALVVGPLFS